MNLDFKQLPLSAALLSNLASLGFENMTPIQEQSLPLLLKGMDVIAKAKTGSGKTAAFGLALLNGLNVDDYSVQGLILCPTRELAEQVSQVLRQLARRMPNVKVLNLSGGMPMKPQLASLRHGAHLIVGTPGRIQKHLVKESLSLKNLQTLVLDEADRMLDMGFIDAIKAIVALCPQRRQTLLFSATYSPEIKKLARQFMKNPQEILIEEQHSALDLEQRFYEVDNQAAKLPLLKALLLHYKPSSTLIFCNTKQQSADLATYLNQQGFSALPLNGDMEQPERDQAMICFVNQSCSILVATDVAARGLDVKELPAVINFELAFEPEVHIHRIGRTGRAGNKGLALSLSIPADAQRLIAIEEGSTQPLIWGKASELEKGGKIFSPPMVTLCLEGGRKDKIRPGDILGALTKEAGLAATSIGKINITSFNAYIAIQRTEVNKAYQYLQTGKLKGRKFKVRKLLLNDRSFG